MVSPIVQVKKISKVFYPPFSLIHPGARRLSAVKALDAVSFSLDKGKILGILGPNGAGKTTLLKILATLILPDSGTVSIKGYQAQAQSQNIKSIIGLAASDERSFYWRLTGLQNLRFYATLLGLKKKEASVRINELFRTFTIAYQDKRFDSYSTGMKRKFILMRALLHTPEVLLLDEPTKSLDYNTGHLLKNHIKSLAAQGMTILFATHDIEEAQQLCDTFVILHEGKACGCGTIEDLKEKSSGADLRTLYLNLTQDA